jgi:hypothetical protein
VNVAETAAAALADLKAALADLADAEDWDGHGDVVHDTLDFAVKQAGHLSKRHGGYIVVLDRGLKDEDTATLIRFLLNINGLTSSPP